MIRMVLALLAALTLAGPAGAVAFSRADKDGDRQVTYDEANRVMPKLDKVHFVKCDKDRDGRLTRGEFACVDTLYSIIRVED